MRLARCRRPCPEVAERVKQGTKRFLFGTLRVLVCAGLLAYVVSRMTWHDYATLAEDTEPARVVGETDDTIRVAVGPDEVRTIDKAELAKAGGRVEYGVVTAVTRLQLGWAVAALLIFAPQPVLGAVRWWLLLRVVGVRLRLLEAAKLTYLGNFFNLISPAMTGGDLVKAYSVAQHTARRAEAITVIFVDRAIGLAGLVLVGAAAALSQFHRAEIVWLAYAGVGLMAGLVVGCYLLVWPGPRRLLRIDWLLARLPFGETVSRVDQAVGLFRFHRSAVGLALLLTVGVHMLNLTALGAVGHGMQLRAGWDAYYVYLPIGFLMAGFVPTPQGLGVLEWAFLKFLAGVASASQAALLAVAARLLQFVWALPGLVISLAGAHRPSPERLAELTRQGEPTAACPRAADGTSPPSARDSDRP